MLKNVWNTTGGITSHGVFTVVLLAIVVGWILVSLWTRVIENTMFGNFGFNENSAWDSMLVAFAVTSIFIAFIWMVDKYGFVSGEDIASEERLVQSTTIGSGFDLGSSPSRNTVSAF